MNILKETADDREQDARGEQRGSCTSWTPALLSQSQCHRGRGGGGCCFSTLKKNQKKYFKTPKTN